MLAERVLLLALIVLAVSWAVGALWWGTPSRLSAKGAGVLIGALWYFGASWWVSRRKHFSDS